MAAHVGHVPCSTHFSPPKPFRRLIPRAWQRVALYAAAAKGGPPAQVESAGGLGVLLEGIGPNTSKPKSWGS